KRLGADADDLRLGAVAGRPVVGVGRRAGQRQRTRVAALVAGDAAALHPAGGRRFLSGLRLVHRLGGSQGVVSGAAVEQVAVVHRRAAAAGMLPRRAGLVLAEEGARARPAAVAAAADPGAGTEEAGRLAVDQRAGAATPGPAAGGADLSLALGGGRRFSRLQADAAQVEAVESDRSVGLSGSGSVAAGAATAAAASGDQVPAGRRRGDRDGQ